MSLFPTGEVNLIQQYTKTKNKILNNKSLNKKRNTALNIILLINIKKIFNLKLILQKKLNASGFYNLIPTFINRRYDI